MDATTFETLSLFADLLGKFLAPIFLTLVSTLAAAAIVYVKDGSERAKLELEEKVKSGSLIALEDSIEAFVKAAEQTFNDDKDDKEAKFRYVERLARAAAKKLKIDIDEDNIHALIENEVYEFKHYYKSGKSGVMTL